MTIAKVVGTMAAEEVDQVLQELRGKYPAAEYDLVPVTTRAGLVVLRSPTHAEYMAVKKMAMEDGTKHMASENQFVMTCVYPEKDSVQRILKRYPAIPSNEKVQRALAYLSGLTDSLEGKG